MIDFHFPLENKQLQTQSQRKIDKKWQRQQWNQFRTSFFFFVYFSIDTIEKDAWNCKATKIVREIVCVWESE